MAILLHCFIFVCIFLSGPVEWTQLCDLALKHTLFSYPLLQHLEDYASPLVAFVVVCFVEYLCGPHWICLLCVSETWQHSVCLRIRGRDCQVVGFGCAMSSTTKQEGDLILALFCCCRSFPVQFSCGVALSHKFEPKWKSQPCCLVCAIYVKVYPTHVYPCTICNCCHQGVQNNGWVSCIAVDSTGEWMVRRPALTSAAWHLKAALVLCCFALDAGRFVEVLRRQVSTT